MRQFSLLLRFKLLTIYRAIRRLPATQKGIALLFTLVVLGFMGGGFELAFRIFTYLRLQAVVGRPLAFHMLDLLLLTMFGLLVVSSVVSAIPTLFRSREIPFLLSNPIAHANLYLTKFVENFLYTSWATFVLVVPVLLAFGVAFGMPAGFTLLTIIGLLPLVLLAVSLGVLLTLLGSLLLAVVPVRVFTLSLLAVAAALAYLGLRIAFPSLAPLEQIETFTQFNRYLASLEVTTPYAPSSWLVDVARSGLNREAAAAGFSLLLLVTTSLAAFQAAYLLARKTYYRSWSRSLESRERRHVRSRRPVELIRRLFPGVTGAIVHKDIRLFGRDPAELTQTFFLAVLLTVYLLILGSLPKIQPSTSFWAAIVAYVNFGTLGYFLATFSMRFVFPIVSLEGQSAWILWSAPFRPTRIFWTKLVSNTVVFLFLTEGLTLLAANILRLDGFVRTLSFLIVFFLDLSLVSLSLSLGALFPNFRERNPSRLSSSPAGIVTILLSLGYVLAVVILLAPAVSSHFSAQFSGAAFNPNVLISGGIGVVVLSVFATFVPLTFAVRRFRSYDF